MSEDWSSVSAEAALGLLEAGTSATLIPPQTATSGPVSAVGSDPSGEACTVVIDQYSASERASSGIADGEVRLLMAASGLSEAPTVHHKVSVAGATYSVLDVMTLQPGGVPVMYELRAK